MDDGSKGQRVNGSTGQGQEPGRGGTNKGRDAETGEPASVRRVSRCVISDSVREGRRAWVGVVGSVLCQLVLHPQGHN